MDNNIKKHRDQLYATMMQLITIFGEKQDLKFLDWADKENFVVDFDSTDVYNFEDILYDLTTNQPKGQITEWQETCLDNYRKNDEINRINYKSWCMGLRYEDIKEKT